VHCKKWKSIKERACIPFSQNGLCHFFSMIPKEKYPPKTIISSRGNKKKFNKIREWPLYSIIRLSTMGLTGFEAYIWVHLGESLFFVKPTACCLGLYITQKVSRGDSRLPRTTKHYHFHKFRRNRNHLFNRF
jgi:hypothetical protein